MSTWRAPFRSRFAAVALFAAFAAPAAAARQGEASAPPPTAVAEAEVRPVVVEMFLSQACSACPPAARHLAELSRRPDVFALSWHVDYWDMMATGEDGAWRDPYAHAAYSERQRAYNSRLIGRRKVFTPQAVVGGAQSVVGSRRARLVETIEARQVEAAPAAQAAPALLVSGSVVQVFAGDAPSDVLLVRFIPLAETDILSGANAGSRFVEANVVTQASYLARNLTGAATLDLPAFGAAPSLGCALLLQGVDMGRIAAVARCDD